MCNAWNHPPGCNCGWGGSGTGGGWVYGWGGLGRTSNSLSKQPETRQICCWWCGAFVYYHTNGYGDSVLFDSLGYPWQVHECWQKHKNETQSISTWSRISSFYCSTPVFFVKAPSIQGSVREEVKGYIIDNHSFHADCETFTFLVDDCPASYRWVYFDVIDSGGSRFRFLIPSIFAKYYKNYSIVEINGKWINKGHKQILVATKISQISYPFGRTETREFIRTDSIQGRSRFKLQATISVSKERVVGIARNIKKETEPCSPKSKATKKRTKSAALQKGTKSQKKKNNLVSKQVSRRMQALSMYQKGISLQEISNSLDITIELHVLQMLLKAAIQTIKDRKEKPSEVAIAHLLNLPIEKLRKQFGHLYKVESQSIRLKDLGTS